MNVLEIGKNTFETPGNWEEVTPLQATDIASALLSSSTIQDFKSRLMLRWLKLEGKIYSHNDRIYTNQGSKRKTLKLHSKGKAMYISPEDWYMLCETLDWLFIDSQNGKARHFHSGLTRNLFPVIKAGSVKLYGPDNGLANCSAIEFAKADTRLMSYRNTGEGKYLDELIAVLYRPRRKFRYFSRIFYSDFSTDLRVKYSDAHLINSSKISLLPAELRQVILMWFEGCSHAMADKYTAVFSGGDSSNDDSGWAGVFQRIADKATEIESVMEVNIHTLLFDLNERIKHAKANSTPNPQDHQ